jgi:phage terminase small subunit
VLEEMRRLAFSDVTGLFDEQGNLKPIHTLTKEQAAAIASLEVVRRNLASGDGHTDVVQKLKVWDKTKALEMLAKHFALLTEVVKFPDGLTVTWQDKP